MKKRPYNAKPRVSSAASQPAPVGGWNARDSLADMAVVDAESMENWFPSTTTVTVRQGYDEIFDNGTGQIQSLMCYTGGTREDLFAVDGIGDLRNVTGGVGGGYLSLPGASGDYASTPSTDALNAILYEIDVRAYIAPDDWSPSSPQAVIGKYGAAGERQWLFLIRSADIRFLVAAGTDVTGGTSTLAPGFVDGTAHWIRCTAQVNVPSSFTTRFTFYTSEDGTTWAQLGAVVESFGFVNMMPPRSAPVTLGASAGGTADLYAGKIYQTQVYDGIGGTLVSEFDGSLTGSSTGEVYTLHGNASIAPFAQLTGLSNGRFQHVNFATSGGNYLVMCNGADDVYNYDGTTWTQPTITGVTSSSLVNVNIHKSRLWFIENGTLKAWYLPTQSIAGAANALDLSAYCPHGGYLMAMGTWTIDAGYGVDDMAVFVTSQGDCLVYRGTDPSSATTWSLVGVWWIGQPIGRRCFVKYQGDMLIVCEDGLFQLSQALQSSRVNPRVALTDKIQKAMSNAVTLYRNNFGWQVIPFPPENMVILNVPTQQGQYQEQYVMNTITGAWCKFTGWDANCWELFGDSIYFGGNGFVGKAFTTLADNGEDISGTVQQAFNYYETPGQLKRFTMMRPTLLTNGTPEIQGAINVDFNLSPPVSNLATLTITGAAWDSAVWDTDLWQDELITSRNWQGAVGIGYCGGVRLDSSTNGVQLQWVATDVVMEPGGVI